MMSEKIVKNMVNTGAIDADETIKHYMDKYLGMTREQFFKNQNNKMMLELVQLLCLRAHRGIKFKGSGWEYDERLNDAVFLVPT